MSNELHFPTRRQILRSASCGFGYLALTSLLSKAGLLSTGRAQAAEGTNYASPLAVKAPHFEPRAKRVIFLFMQGGPSHVDTFDWKPELAKSGGKSSRGSGKGQKGGRLLPSPWKFEPRGKSGLPISELFPAISEHADDLCLLNGMHTDTPAHPQATVFLHTGNVQFVRPSLGAWTLYGLGTENADLPGFVTINPPARLGGAENYGSAFLPACFQGTRLSTGGGAPIKNLESHLSSDVQRSQVDLVQSMNRSYLERSGPDSQIEGVIQSYELAFRMQESVPRLMDIDKEPTETLAAYGIGKKLPTDSFGRQCLLARRFAEGGVRFIEISHNGWDQHNNLKTRLAANAKATDQPIAALIADLKERGLFEDTLIVWGGEFGRTPQDQNNGDGRRHNNRGYTMWLAGGGVKGGLRYGATDPIGAAAVENRTHVHDLHATILHLLGLDHERLTYRYAGRDFRLTDVYGKVLKDIVS